MTADIKERLAILLLILVSSLGMFWAGEQHGRQAERAEIGPVWEFVGGRWRERGLDGRWRVRTLPMSPRLSLEAQP